MAETFGFKYHTLKKIYADYEYSHINPDNPRHWWSIVSTTKFFDQIKKAKSSTDTFSVIANCEPLYVFLQPYSIEEIHPPEKENSKKYDLFYTLGVGHHKGVAIEELTFLRASKELEEGRGCWRLFVFTSKDESKRPDIRVIFVNYFTKMALSGDVTKPSDESRQLYADKDKPDRANDLIRWYLMEKTG